MGYSTTFFNNWYSSIYNKNKNEVKPLNQNKMTAVEWLYEELDNYHKMKSKFRSKKAILEQAKQMEKEKAHGYAEFAIRCDRKDMKILNFEDWIKL